MRHYLASALGFRSVLGGAPGVCKGTDLVCRSVKGHMELSGFKMTNAFMTNNGPTNIFSLACVGVVVGISNGN